MNAANSSTGGDAGSADHAHPRNVWVVRCVVCAGPCDAADAASRQGVVTVGWMCYVCFRSACDSVSEDNAHSEAGEGDEDAYSEAGEGGDYDSIIDAANEAAAWGAALDGWNSPGSSLVDVGEAAVD